MHACACVRACVRACVCVCVCEMSGLILTLGSGKSFEISCQRSGSLSVFAINTNDCAVKNMTAEIQRVQIVKQVFRVTAWATKEISLLFFILIMNGWSRSCEGRAKEREGGTHTENKARERERNGGGGEVHTHRIRPLRRERERGGGSGRYTHRK